MQSILKYLAAGATAVALSSCASVQSDVTRFHTLPPQGNGQTFTIRAASSSGGIEFGTYSARVASHLQNYGWTQASTGGADYTVMLDYRMGGSSERHGSMPITGQTGGGTTYHSGSVNSYGSYGSASGSYSGTSYTPATFGVVGSVPYSVTVHDRYLNMRISDRAGRSVFEGRVVSTGQSADIAAVLPQMIDSLFTKFPGESGKTKRVEKASQ
jgi:Domain of unknown function (DUF4136)